MKNIGIIGRGFVGNAVAEGFSKKFNYDANIRVFDIDTKKSTHSIKETVNESDFIFLSVPTPNFSSGQINLSIVNNALKSIDTVNQKNNIVLLRSTVVPGTTQFFQNKFKNLNLVFNPEFLTERNAVLDFANQKRAIIGGESSYVEKVSTLYKDRFGETISIIKTNFQTAEMIKYMNNLFLATKVSFLNDMKILSDKVNIDWDMAIKGFSLDERVGSSHNDVPGHDGKLGFGGSCLSKDMQALIKFADEQDIDMTVLKGAWETNLKVRSNKDGENLRGQAITKDD
jgi:nucleotide sugar dehydrogenase